MGSKRLSKETYKAVENLAHQGLTDKEIAARLNIKVRTAKDVRSEQLGIWRYRPRPDYARLHELAAEGWPYKEIAQDITVSRNAAFKHEPELARNGRSAAAIARWANKHCPDLWEDIKKMEIE